MVVRKSLPRSQRRRKQISRDYMFPLIGDMDVLPERQTIIFDWPAPISRWVPQAALIIKDEFPLDPALANTPAGTLVSSGVKWQQNGSMYGWYQNGHDLRRLAWNWWLAMLMIDYPKFFGPILKVVNRVRGIHDWVSNFIDGGFGH